MLSGKGYDKATHKSDAFIYYLDGKRTIEPVRKDVHHRKRWDKQQAKGR